ncbi:MAG: tetratricopeptide repeat protein [Bacteroidetes bacterium]|nr:tetratricopeptide repeat protein [Bacteroidota bacterium]
MATRLDQLLDLLQKEPHDFFLNYALALEYAKQDKKEKAISIIEHILKRDENYLGAYYQMGQLYEQLQQLEKARVTYTKGIAIAQRQKNTKAAGELSTALLLIEE